MSYFTIALFLHDTSAHIWHLEPVFNLTVHTTCFLQFHGYKIVNYVQSKANIKNPIK